LREDAKPMGSGPDGIGVFFRKVTRFLVASALQLLWCHWPDSSARPGRGFLLMRPMMVVMVVSLARMRPMVVVRLSRMRPVMVIRRVLARLDILAGGIY
jgi:hypothetical protein